MLCLTKFSLCGIGCNGLIRRDVVNILKFFKPDAGEVYRENARLKKMIEEYAKAARHSNKVEGIKRHSDNLIIKQIEKLIYL